MNTHNVPNQAQTEDVAIILRYLDIQNAFPIPLPTRDDKIRALQRLDIPVTDNQHPLTAWTLAMCRENGLPAVTPALVIGEVAAELCPTWVWWLA